MERDMNEKEITELKEKYKTMGDDELISMVSIDRPDYKPEAIELAKAELANRNILFSDQVKKVDEVRLQRKQEKEEAENKPLSVRQKVLFTIFPGIAFWYSLFVPKDWIRRKKEANLANWLGFALWIGLILFFSFLYRRRRP